MIGFAGPRIVSLVAIQHHDKTCWVVPAEAQVRARRLASPGEEEGTRQPIVPRAPGAAAVPPRVFRLTAYTGQQSKAVSVGTRPMGNLEDDPSAVMNDERFFPEVRERAEAKGIAPEALDAIYLKVGNRRRKATLDWARTLRERERA